MSALVLGGLCLLLAAAPFERLEPLWRAPGQNFSSTETVMLSVLAVWGATLVVTRRRLVWSTPLTAPALAMLAAALLAALLASSDRMNAVHMVGRLLLAGSVFLLTVNAAATPPQVRLVMTTMALAGAGVSVLIILEYLGVRWVVEVLRPFHRGQAVVGAQVRASGPFQYPTIASMYLEMAFAFGLGLMLTRVDEGRRWFLPVLVLGVIAEGVVLTFTRSGLITMVVSLLFVCVLRLSQRGVEQGTVALGAVAAVLATLMLSARSAEALRLRMTSEGQESWYRADVEAPARLSLGTGELATVPIVLTNRGRSSWDPDGRPPINFSYHWLEGEDDTVVVWEGQRTPLPRAIAPGESITLNARVRAPGRPGDFRIAWDLEQVRRLWFSTEPEAVVNTTDASVKGPVVTVAESSIGPRVMPHPQSRPGRAVLWRAALRLLAAHPLTGIGLDNYRLQYGTAAGLTRADTRVHSNNLYLEWVVGTGLVGLAALTWYSVRVARSLRLAAARVDSVAHGIAAAMLAVALHGMADAFLSFTVGYVAMAAVAGLLVTTSARAEAYAYRL